MGNDSGGEKMSLENMWILFACVTMSVLAYAVLKPLICTCTKKPPPLPPRPEPTEPVAVIKIHPARAAFRLFPPGQAYYLGGPPKKPVKPKKKKNKQKAKWNAVVNKIITSNAIQSFAQLSKAQRCDGGGPDDTVQSADDPASANVNSDLNHRVEGAQTQPKNPNVFSVSLPGANDAQQLNGGALISKFAKAVQLIQNSKKQQDKGKSPGFGLGNKVHATKDPPIINSMTGSQSNEPPSLVIPPEPQPQPPPLAFIVGNINKDHNKTDKSADDYAIIEIKDDDDDYYDNNVKSKSKSKTGDPYHRPKPKPILKKAKELKSAVNFITKPNSISVENNSNNSISNSIPNSNSVLCHPDSLNTPSTYKIIANSTLKRQPQLEEAEIEELPKLKTITVQVNTNRNSSNQGQTQHEHNHHQVIHIS